MSEDLVELERRVVRTVEVAPDLQVHISVVTVDSERFVEIRTWIVSNQAYGRGVVVPLAHARQVRDALAEILRTEPR